MKSIHRRMLFAALLMFAGAGLALAMKPTRKIADTREKPVLVRISSIDRDPQGAYQLQESFIKSMLGALSEKDRARISGRFGA